MDAATADKIANLEFDDVAVPVQTACAIKGNISRKGDKIYHLPGGRDYDRTIITTSSGERMFCSEDETKAANWRAERG
jgi:hypothetical protein